MDDQDEFIVFEEEELENISSEITNEDKIHQYTYNSPNELFDFYYFMVRTNRTDPISFFKFDVMNGAKMFNLYSIFLVDDVVVLAFNSESDLANLIDYLPNILDPDLDLSHSGYSEHISILCQEIKSMDTDKKPKSYDKTLAQIECDSIVALKVNSELDYVEDNTDEVNAIIERNNTKTKRIYDRMERLMDKRTYFVNKYPFIRYIVKDAWNHFIELMVCSALDHYIHNSRSECRMISLSQESSFHSLKVNIINSLVSYVGLTEISIFEELIKEYTLEHHKYCDDINYRDNIMFEVIGKMKQYNKRLIKLFYIFDSRIDKWKIDNDDIIDAWIDYIVTDGVSDWFDQSPWKSDIISEHIVLCCHLLDNNLPTELTKNIIGHFVTSV